MVLPVNPQCMPVSFESFAVTTATGHVPQNHSSPTKKLKWYRGISSPQNT